ncbi:dephospho-CoA kinase [Salsuginibacillus halophilus]|uniref:Dephospho-CoA kinase n=1 Tax=Salsuginibacillus halophilus TaxID=517424 RepID=A0A2P8HCU7_9BACI|nr:dephospho-CoA kinase [Salsuginibacillus halophilus]PSL44063.1 dephospho-CoA kinase [Salsuginibacillus halophilus]
MIIGLTGGIASGKSLVADWFKQEDIPVVDADEVARQVVAPGANALQEIVNTFSEEVLLEDGSLDRKALGRKIFGDEQRRQQLNDIMHPAIRTEMTRQQENWQAEGYENIVLDLPLLIENELFYMVDRVVVVYVDPHTQLERLQARDNEGAEDAKQRIASQKRMDEKRSYADAVLNNTGTVEETKTAFQNLLDQWNLR